MVVYEHCYTWCSDATYESKRFPPVVGLESLSCVDDMGCTHKQRCVCMFGISESIWKAYVSSHSVSISLDKRNTVLTDGGFARKGISLVFILTLYN